MVEITMLHFQSKDKSLEMLILDAIGAIGIARTFQFSGHFNEPMWTESPYHSIPSEKDMVDLPPSAIRHFYDKLLKLKN